MKLTKFQVEIITNRLKERYNLQSDEISYSHCGLGQYEKWIEMIKHSIELDPDYTYAWYNLARVYLTIKKKDKALQSYNKALEIDPNFNLYFWIENADRRRCANLLYVCST